MHKSQKEWCPNEVWQQWHTLDVNVSKFSVIREPVNSTLQKSRPSKQTNHKCLSQWSDMVVSMLTECLLSVKTGKYQEI